ncbi:MAG TPA: 1-deoxy-D-xylulose-5-phosphate synthase [Bacteroidales bacterium]|nr:1-deoxy-D-xylulose-5-phosphate synthase [Bacteroidales bacterium]
MKPSKDLILTGIDSPEDLRKLSVRDLPRLCDEIREYIIDVVSGSGGHLGASLGVVELTVALHYVFNTPDDKLIWDVGHQAYAHKILCERREAFREIRKHKGISGFPKMEESVYDAFGTGHSSTSISAALGMAIASRLKGETGRMHIAVIGDGSMTAGQAMEALNNAGVAQANLLVILNDNGIAIDRNVGAIAKYFTDITTSRAYNRLKDRIWYLLGGGTRYGANTRAVVRQLGGAVKSTLLGKSNMFEAFNLRYFGPVDGHDVIRLVQLFRDLKQIPGPKLLHCRTVKGKGFEFAERDQITFHAPGTFDRNTGEMVNEPCGEAPKYQHVFGRTLLELAQQNPAIVGITPAMPSGCSMNIMMAVMPERVFDVGIAEQHAVTFAAGLAAQGMVPYCNIYSSFLQRAYDQVIHDVALQKLPVVLCLDRGGLVGEDGPTHHGVFDLAFLRTVPGLTICAPMDEHELRHMMFTAQEPGMGPVVIRYPRGRGVHAEWKNTMERLPIGKGRCLRQGDELALVSIGHAGNFAAEAAEMLAEQGYRVSHYDMRFLKPLDEDLLRDAFRQHKYVITIEDGSVKGGFGSAVLETRAAYGYKTDVKILGVPDRFMEQGSLSDLYRICGFDAQGIVAASLACLQA